jgi:AcrR family transcriptional regulator
MDYAEFKRRLAVSRQDICREVLAQKRSSIRLKKEDRALRNLDKIFGVALAISNRKGFQAMSMRELSRETGMSMGALYGCFSGKEELLEVLQHQGRTIASRTLLESVAAETEPAAQLKAAVKTHLYLSEAMRPWFYFSYMEAKNLARGELAKAVASERFTEQVFADILEEGRRRGVFHHRDTRLTAGAIKALLQDWYLKRGKHAERDVDVDGYARFVLELIHAIVGAAPRAADDTEEVDRGQHRSAGTRP